MNLNSHVQELRRKHENLSKRVQTAQNKPGRDTLEIGEMKKLKLKIKEQIQRLETV